MPAIMPEFYNSAGLNSSTKAVCQELQGMGSHFRATPAGVNVLAAQYFCPYSE